LIDPYFPNAGDALQIITFGSREGNPASDFGSKSGLDIGNGLRLDPRYDATSLTLVAVATPVPPPPSSRPPSGKHPSEAAWATLHAGPILGLKDKPAQALTAVALGRVKHQVNRNQVDAFFQVLAED
jgi:hypothetical protein